jgi:CheY-like chemotaxis protein
MRLKSVWLKSLIKKISNKKVTAEGGTRNNFLAILNREIRTPLNAVIGLGQLEMKNKSLSMSSKNTIEKILTSGQNLLKAVNDILDLNRIENGDLEIISREYDVPSLVNDVCVVSRARIVSKPIEFRVSVSPNIPGKLVGDNHRIKQILGNFLSNAIKNTERGFVSFSVDSLSANKNFFLKFKISDSGPGLKSQEIPDLFKEEKTGLELLIAKKLADFMGASIEVSSGESSNFSICIPQVVGNSNPIGETVAENLEKLRFSTEKTLVSKDFTLTKLTVAKVLIVDDVQMNLEVMKGLLELYELDIDTATSGQQAIDMLKSGNRYDIIFMDYMMPVMDGIEATRIIRNLEGDYFKKVFIVAFTANALTGSDKMFLENEFDDFISKPVDIRSLDVCLNKWLDKKKEASEQNKSGDPQILRRYVNFTEGAEQFGSEEVFKKVLGSFKKNTPDLLTRLREQSGNDYAISIHALKGCARTIFAKELGNRAYELETAAKDGNWELVKSKNEDLIKDVQNLIDAISVD